MGGEGDGSSATGGGGNCAAGGGGSEAASPAGGSFSGPPTCARPKRSEGRHWSPAGRLRLLSEPNSPASGVAADSSARRRDMRTTRPVNVSAMAAINTYLR